MWLYGGDGGEVKLSKAESYYLQRYDVIVYEPEEMACVPSYGVSWREVMGALSDYRKMYGRSARRDKRSAQMRECLSNA